MALFAVPKLSKWHFLLVFQKYDFFGGGWEVGFGLIWGHFNLTEREKKKWNMVLGVDLLVYVKKKT